jgi:hypothetical protein
MDIRPKSQNPVDVARETMGKMVAVSTPRNLAGRHVSTGEINRRCDRANR